MIKADICDMVYDRIGFSKVEAVEVVEVVFDVLKEALGKGEKVQIVGFGAFSVREKKERLGRNPKTGTEMWLSPRRGLAFKPSKILREVINSSDGFSVSNNDGFGKPLK